MRKAVIFDLDGTLWDATVCAPAIWNRIFDKHDEVNFKMTQELAASLMGKTMEEIGDTLFPELSESLRREIVDEFGDEEVSYLTSHGARLFDGMENVVHDLYQNYDLYIVSNCQDGYVPAFLSAHHMGRFFKDIEMSGRTGMNKGKNICLLMERNGILKEDAVYVGDTAGDEEAARYAGIHFIWAGYGFGKAMSPDAALTDIGELPSRLLPIWSKKKVIAACGNDCAACPRYVAHPYEKTDAELHHTAELWMKIGYRDHIVSNDEISCTGCKPENWCRYHVVKCCEDKGIKNCSECASYPCQNMKECFEITQSFEPICKKICTEEEYLRIKKAFFEKEQNLAL